MKIRVPRKMTFGHRGVKLVGKKGAEVGVVQPEKVTTLNQDMTEPNGNTLA